MWISPSYQDVDFRQPLRVDDKIRIFEDRTIGWKLDIAVQVINGKRRPDGSEEKPPIPHSGFAALDIVFSYFEMIAKYEDGYARAKPPRSGFYFKQGVFSVFPYLNEARTPAYVPGVEGEVVSIADYVLDLMWEGIRCGLYHGGIMNGRVILTGDSQQPMGLDLQNLVLIINPHLLVTALMEHFTSYVEQLKDPSNQSLREKFEVRFDFDTRV